MRYALLVLAVLALSGCGGEESASDEREEEFVVVHEGPWGGDSAKQVFAQGDGKVSVLLLGMEDCEKTREATRALAALAPALPDDVHLARIDVPPPPDLSEVGGALEITFHSDLAEKIGYAYAVDERHEIASKLDFFYYPTLYVLDREGAVRFSGGCDPAALTKMIAAVRAEKPDDEKVVFTPPLPAVGSTTPDFAVKTLAGESTTLKALRASGPILLLFTSKDCPFSGKAVQTLSDLADETEGAAVTLLAIEKSGDAAGIAKFYEDLDLPCAAVHDADGSIFRKYGVEPVPFFFLIAADGTIGARGSYTQAAALAALGIGDAAAAPSGAG